MRYKSYYRFLRMVAVQYIRVFRRTLKCLYYAGRFVRQRKGKNCMSKVTVFLLDVTSWYIKQQGSTT